MSEEHEALKAAYHALETESVTRRSANDGSSGELQQLRQELRVATDRTLELQVELQAATKRNIELSKTANSNIASAATAVELENKLRLVLAEKARLESAVKSALDELDSYKKLTEKLKVRDCIAYWCHINFQSVMRNYRRRYEIWVLVARRVGTSWTPLRR